MSTSRKRFTEFLECLRHLDRSIDRCVDLFADDGVFEFPYFTSLGMPWRVSGKAEVRQVLELIAVNQHPNGTPAESAPTY